VPALRLVGARLTGRISLAHADIAVAIELRHCALDQPLVLEHANLRALDLTGSHLPGLTARRLRVDSDLTLDRCTITGETNLVGAAIRGQLDLLGTHLSNPGSIALYADRITIDGGVFCVEGFTATGELRLPGRNSQELWIAGPA
jgi:hypothetical protein